MSARCEFHEGDAQRQPQSPAETDTCVRCGALICRAKIPDRRGSEWGCSRTKGHGRDVFHENPLIPPALRYER